MGDVLTTGTGSIRIQHHRRWQEGTTDHTMSKHTEPAMSVRRDGEYVVIEDIEIVNGWRAP